MSKILIALTLAFSPFALASESPGGVSGFYYMDIFPSQEMDSHGAVYKQRIDELFEAYVDSMGPVLSWAGGHE